MGRIGLSEIFVIAIVVLILVNPKEFPGFFRRLGKLFQQMKDMRDAFKRSVVEATATMDSEREPQAGEKQPQSPAEGAE